MSNGKYRGWTKNTNRRVEGYYCVVEGKHFIVPDDAELTGPGNYKKGITGFIGVIPESVGQATGLKDKNGKQLDWWEGDIFEHPSGVCAIKYKDGGLYMHGAGDWTPVGAAAHWAVLPVKIGSVWENPELMESPQ